jgi:ribosomal protein S18 acetylase RimI-like enzyme
VNTALRRAVPEDAIAVRALVREAYARWVPLIGREPKPMGADYAQAIRAHLVWVMDRENQIVAVLEAIPHADHLLVENVAVAPTHQGQGIAKQLMAFAEALAEERGLKELRLYTNERFEANIALYTKLGYIETHRQDFPQLGGTSTVAVFMHKQLGGGSR